MTLDRSAFLIVLIAANFAPLNAQTPQPIPVLYTAVVSNYKGLPVTKPDFPNGGAIIEFDTSKSTHIRAVCVNTADHKTTFLDNDKATHEIDVPGNKCSQASAHVGESFSVVPFTIGSFLAYQNAEGERHAQEVGKLSEAVRAGRQYTVKGLAEKLLWRAESSLILSFTSDDGITSENVELSILEETIKGKK